MNGVDCFGTHLESSAVCAGCAVSRQCRSVTVSHGLDMVNHVLQEMVEALPADGAWLDTQSDIDLVDILSNPAHLTVRVTPPNPTLFPGADPSGILDPNTVTSVNLNPGGLNPANPFFVRGKPKKVAGLSVQDI